MTVELLARPAEAATPAGVPLSLPRARVLAGALLAPAPPAVPGTRLAEVRSYLERELPLLAAGVPASRELRVDSYRLDLVLHRPERSGSVGTFSPSPARCRRSIGLAAVERCVRGRSPNPGAAVAEILAEGVGAVVHPTGGVRAPWWASWFRELPLGARGVVQAEAVTWASQLWTAFEWSGFERQPALPGSDDWWHCPGARQVTFRGQAEVRAWTGGRPVLAVVGRGLAPPVRWRAELGFPALVAALARGERAAPARVVGIWPATGQIRILPVGLAALREAASAAVSAVATLVDAQLEDGARSAR